MPAGSGSTSTAVFPRYFSRTFQAFRHRDFRLLWSGAFTSTTGTWMQNVAQSWLVLSMTGSAFYLGLIGFLADLPILLFSLVGGVVADRLDRRKLLLGSQYAQMTCAFVLTALVVAGWLCIPGPSKSQHSTGTSRRMAPGLSMNLSNWCPAR